MGSSNQYLHFVAAAISKMAQLVFDEIYFIFDEGFPSQINFQ